jgi:hypothetical protein
MPKVCLRCAMGCWVRKGLQRGAHRHLSRPSRPSKSPPNHGVGTWPAGSCSSVVNVLFRVSRGRRLHSAKGHHRQPLRGHPSHHGPKKLDVVFVASRA